MGEGGVGGGGVGSFEELRRSWRILWSCHCYCYYWDRFVVGVEGVLSKCVVVGGRRFIFLAFFRDGSDGSDSRVGGM